MPAPLAELEQIEDFRAIREEKNVKASKRLPAVNRRGDAHD